MLFRGRNGGVPLHPLSPLEQAELDAFLEENLRTRRI